jgi:hypothetical protein
VDGISFDSILESEASWLERAFEEEEVRKVELAMVGNKAPGPDGISMAFFQACWDVLRGDIMEVLRDFHDCVFFLKSLNASFISLIPKFQVLLLSKIFGLLVLWVEFTKYCYSLSK